MADTKNKESLLHLYNTVLTQLAQQIHGHLTEIIPLFDDYNLEKVVDTFTKDRENPSDIPLSLENGNVGQIGLRLQLLGFQQPGAPAFDVAKDLVLLLGHSTFTVGPDRNTVWLEKPYGQGWTKNEGEEIAQSWTAEVIDAISAQLPSAE